jgi:hypothetical protein
MRALRWGLLFCVAACGDDDENPAPTASRGYSVFDELTTTNDACLPRAFKADASGRVPLRYVVTLPANDTKCPYGAPVSEATRAALANDLATGVGVACEMAQLTERDFEGPDCIKSQTPGWCYVPTAGGAGCVAHAYLSIGAAPISGPSRRVVVLEP